MSTATPPSVSKKAPAASVRGFFNLSTPEPDFGAVEQKDLGSASAVGGGGLLYGKGNTVPVIAMTAAHQSGTAYRCLERRAQFLEGLGFPTPERDPKTGALLRPEEAGTMGETPVPGHGGAKTANDLWAELCSYGGYLNGAAVLVRYTNAANIGEVHVLPFGSVRKTQKGTYLLNHKFGRKGYKESDSTEHLPFNPDPKQVRREMAAAKALAEQQKKPYVQAGQIYYIYTPKAGEEDYPLPPHWAGLEDILADGELARFDLENIRNGFYPNAILTLIGQQNNTVVDEDGDTEADRTDDELRDFTGNGANPTGRKKILVLDAPTKDQAPILTAFDGTGGMLKTDQKKEALGQVVCRHIGIPPILAGFAKAGQLGAAQEIMNAAQLTQSSLEPLRKLLLRAFWRLMPALSGLVPAKLNLVELTKIVSTPMQP